MNLLRFFITVLLIVSMTSCKKEKIKESVIIEKNLDLQVLELYQEGIDELIGGDIFYAAKKFNEAELLYPQSIWAPKSLLMAAYSYYSQDYYLEAISELERYFLVYPKHENLDYAYYLLGICYYEQIIDEKKDLDAILKAKEYFSILLIDYRGTDYAEDAAFKLDLIEDVLAAKEMYIGRYYLEKKKWIPAINRFRSVVDNYQTTIYVEESLYRLVEIYYILGLEEEAKKYAKLLGYNYQSSHWYERSYKIFDKMYEINKKKISKNKDKKSSILKKFKKLF
tara:strand:+ start:1594 stop:2436 length:843 start_codon:yes stop_codon:yes gene_type:complete